MRMMLWKQLCRARWKQRKEDLKLYHQMMDQTKQVFLQGLRQFRQNNGNKQQQAS